MWVCVYIYVSTCVYVCVYMRMLCIYFNQGCCVFIQYNLLKGCCEWILIQPWTQVIDYSLLGLARHTRLRIGISHLSISGIVIHGRCYISHCFYFLLLFYFLIVCWFIFCIVFAILFLFLFYFSISFTLTLQILFDLVLHLLFYLVFVLLYLLSIYIIIPHNPLSQKCGEKTSSFILLFL